MKNSIQSPDELLREARQKLTSNPRFLKRKVRVVAHENELEDERVLALYTLACGRKFHWTPADWKIIADKLDDCELTIGEWLGEPEAPRCNCEDPEIAQHGPTQPGHWFGCPARGQRGE